MRGWNADEIRKRIDGSGADPIGAHIRILRDELHCLACHGTGLVGEDTVCGECKGDKRQKLTVAQLQASAEVLMKYTCQTLKQVDNISSDGSGLAGIQVVFVDAHRVGGGTDKPLLMDKK